MVPHQPKDGQPPEGSVLKTGNLAIRLTHKSNTQGWSLTNLRMVTPFWPVWHHLARVAHVWPHVTMFGPVWLRWTLFGPVWPRLIPVIILPSLASFGTAFPIWLHLAWFGLFDPIWLCLTLFGSFFDPVLPYLPLFGPAWHPLLIQFNSFTQFYPHFTLLYPFSPLLNPIWACFTSFGIL